jgi:hypothetical protein
MKESYEIWTSKDFVLKGNSISIHKPLWKQNYDRNKRSMMAVEAYSQHSVESHDDLIQLN